ncbi:glycosyltransferase family 1 protein [Corynebacterium sp. HS2168-gen11]|uniref:glycosyltransferase family 4 protein n=1 Tax=Corynebacterium sp. HS2168-gen11 TaxID=2974027 RepID=UPI00216AD86D|nr:glycosyltransferase family 1 protein [Corynebacterium sp. HS2168-gen11]MCS4535746.1 glycosyltransferase family 1 protein [Corynebacterium sp. HS2168-gen11]
MSNSVAQLAHYLAAHGHDCLILAPRAGVTQQNETYCGFRVVRVPEVRVPLINSFRVGVPTYRAYQELQKFQPDIVHAASPYVLAGAGILAAKQLQIPTIAVFQTDIPSFALRYHLTLLYQPAWGWTRILHNRAQRTLAPSSVAQNSLETHGISNVQRWGRGVDTTQFHPDRRSQTLRTTWGAPQRIIVGYVGRLAAEKGVHRLQHLDADPVIQLVIVGDGPLMPALRRQLPNAIFTGQLRGEALARAYASFDIFVHPGEFETFCQTIQEAHASGIPVIAARAGGPIDLVQDGENGQLIDVAKLAAHLPTAVREIVLSPDYAAMCQQARAGVQQNTWPALCDALMGHYREVVASYSQNHGGSC